MTKQVSRMIVGAVLVVALLSTAGVIWGMHATKTVSPRAHSSSLPIREWSVTLPLSAATADAYYTYDAASDQVFISTKQLDTLVSHIPGCKSGLHGLSYRKTAAAPPVLVEQHAIEPLCAVPANSETAQIGTIQAAIRTAARAAVAD